MTKHQLAQELRARQYAYGEVERHIGTFFPKTSRNNLVRQARLHAIELENDETPDERGRELPPA